MNNFLTNDNTSNKTISTLEIAEMMECRHSKILEKLDGTKDGKTKGIIPILNQHDFGLVDYFIKSTYRDAKGEERPCYLVTKLGCDFLANKFTGEKGVLFTAKYVKRFDEMEQALSKNTYSLPMTYKEALIQLLDEVDKNEKLQIENAHKQEIIEGFTEDLEPYKKADIINRICKRTRYGYANRYKELYKTFKELYHIDLEKRCKNYNNEQEKKKDELSVLRYAEKFGFVEDLYACCVKLYETEVRLIVKELYNLENIES